jgi:hypothetical protein
VVPGAAGRPPAAAPAKPLAAKRGGEALPPTALGFVLGSRAHLQARLHPLRRRIATWQLARCCGART